MYIPNILNVNSDINNCFKPFFGEGITGNFEFRVFDKWGNIIYENFGLEDCWKGTLNGSIVEAGIYSYHIKVDMECLKDEMSGTILVTK